MDTNNQPTPEELKAEQEALAHAEVQIEEVRAGVIAEYGFDEATDAERIDKAVTKEIEARKALSAAIGQKIKHRTARQEAEGKLEAAKPKTGEPDIEKTVDTRVTAVLEQRDLDAMEYPDDLKAEIKKVATTQGISVKKAASDPYIQFKIEAWQKEQKIDEATVSRKNRSGGKTEYTFDNPPDVDMSTKEGQEEYEKWRQAMIKAGH